MGATSSASNSRAAAAGILLRWFRTADFPNRLLDEVAEDRAFVMELVYGSVKWTRALEWIGGRLARRPPRPEVRAVLDVGLYQVLWLDSVAPHAAVHETVEAAKLALGAREAGFVNALLRSALRRRDELLAELGKQPVAVRTSHPDALVERWTHAHGPAGAERLCLWNNARPDVVLRLNRLRTGFEALRRHLLEAGIAVVPHQAAPDECLVLPRGVRLENVPGYLEGWFAVLDPSTLASVELLDPRPGELVLDACAAPGGKTFLIAERMRGQGSIVAADLHEDRLGRLRSNIERLGFPNVTVTLADASSSAPGWGGPFDAMLLDVPCTNTGVLRRRPDARWRFDDSRLAERIRTQSAILDRAVASLKSGGRLVYSTCSLEPEENEGVIGAFLEKHPDFHETRRLANVPPDRDMDGAFAALLRRV